MDNLHNFFRLMRICNGYGSLGTIRILIQLKFVRLGIQFTQNHKNQTPSRSTLRVNRVKIMNGPLTTKCPVKISSLMRMRLKSTVKLT